MKISSSHYTGSSTPPTLKKSTTSPFIIQIDSISIDLPNNKNKNIEVETTCDHFSIRKYVSEMRLKNSTACRLFESDDGGNKSNNASEVPSTYTLPPLDVLKFRWWQCQSCLLETATDNEGTVEKSGTSHCTHDLTEMEAAKLVPKFKDIVSLDHHMDETIKHDADNNVLVQANEEEERHHGSENLLKESGNSLKDDVHLELPRPVAVLGQVEVLPLQQITNGKVGHPSTQNEYPCSSNQHNGNLEVGDTRHSTENLQLHIKSSCNDEQMKLMRPSEASRTRDNLIAEIGCSPPEELDEPSSDSDEICPGSRNKSSGLQRRKIRKIRLLSDLLSEKVNPSINGAVTIYSPLLASSDGSEEVGADYVKKGFYGQKRKRSFCYDEEQNLEETVSGKNEAQKVECVKGNSTNSEAVAVSALEKDGNVKISPNSVIKRNEKYGFDPSFGIVKKKLRKEKNNQIMERPFQKRCKAVPSAAVGSAFENVPTAKPIWKIDLNKHKNDYGMVEMKEKKKKKKNVYDEPFNDNVGEPRSKTVPSGSVRAEDDALLGRQAVPFLNPDPKMDENSFMCKKKTQESSVTRTGFGAVQSSSAAIRVIPSDAVSSKDGADPSSVERNRTIQVEYGPSFTREEYSPEEDQLLKRPAKSRRVEPKAPSTSGPGGPLGKEVNLDHLSKGSTYRMPSMCETQNYISLSEGGSPLLRPHKDNAGLSDNGKSDSQNHRSVFKKQCSDVASDDIPMEIVELMATIQYENRLHDASQKECPSLHQPKSVKSGTSGSVKGLSPTKQKAVHFSSQMKTNPSQFDQIQPSKSHGAFLPYQKMSHKDNPSQAVTKQNEAPVSSWSSAVLLNSPPKKRIPPTEFLNFKNPNPEKIQKDIHLQLYHHPPQQNGLKLPSQFVPIDFYSNEKIPAMNLLSLMDAGRSSGQSSSVNATAPCFDKQRKIPHGYRSKEATESVFPSAFPGLSFPVYRTMPDTAAYGGHSSWLVQRDEAVRRGSVVPTPIPKPNPLKVPDKGKRKIEAFGAKKPVSSSPAVHISQTNFTVQPNPVIFHQKDTELGKQNINATVPCPERSSEDEMCTLNRNPADFSILEPSNIYTIRGCDIKSDFKRTLPLLIAQEKMERETKRRVTAADLLAELQIT